MSSEAVEIPELQEEERPDAELENEDAPKCKECVCPPFHGDKSGESFEDPHGEPNEEQSSE